MTAMTKDRRLAAIMFTDIVGYTRLMGTNEDRAFEVLNINREIHKQQIAKFNGSLIKEMGDGMLISFHSAMHAVRCAMAIQEEARMENIPLKIGIHEADVVFEGGDVLGDGVNIASRIQDGADEGSIHISGMIYRNIRNKGDIQSTFVEERSFKNVDEAIKIYKVLFGNESTTPENRDNQSQTPIDLKSVSNRIEKRNKKLIWSAGFLVLVLAVIMIWQFELFKKAVPAPKEIDKSIAVLPFDNESSDEENQYFVNGMMEDIRNNLSKIADLRVISKTSTEKYRGTTMLSKDIARELDVAFLMEGTVQKIGNRVKIHAQLIHAETDNHLWAETYTREMQDVFSLQSEIAQIIAGTMYSTITPKEKEMIESMPTTNLTAYDYFLRARDEHIKYWLEWPTRDQEQLENAIAFYRRALEYDTDFAQAYTGLALAYWNKYGRATYFEEDYLDTLLILADKAISLNQQLEEAYLVKGIYYREMAEFEKAQINLEKPISINPNYTWAFEQLGRLFIYDLYDNVQGLNYQLKALSLDKSSFRVHILNNLAHGFLFLGFEEKAREYLADVLQLANDSASYYGTLLGFNWVLEKFDLEIQNLLKSLKYNPHNLSALIALAGADFPITDENMAHNYRLKVIQRVDQEEDLGIGLQHRLGYIFWREGQTDKAMEYFNLQIDYCLDAIQLNRSYGTQLYAHYDLACVYSFLGEKDKAFRYLEELKEKKLYQKWFITYLKYDPLLDNIRDDPRFKSFLDQALIKYQKEHDRVQAWMEEEGII